MLRMVSGRDTSPPAGCCGATCDCSGVNVSRANWMRGATLDKWAFTGCCGVNASGIRQFNENRA
jgi:hypothetical protein